SFTYGHSVGSDLYPAGAWNRLISADNGQGGIVSFTYENIGNVLHQQSAANYGSYKKNRRGTSKTPQPGKTSGLSYTWQYTDYQEPNKNYLGTGLNNGGPAAYPDSAVLYNNYYSDCDVLPCIPHPDRLVHPAGSEFRGHSSVVEIDPNGNATKHVFY